MTAFSKLTEAMGKLMAAFGLCTASNPWFTIVSLHVAIPEELFVLC